MQVIKRYTAHVIRRYTTDSAVNTVSQGEVPLVVKKLTPVEFRAQATDVITKNLSEWIKENADGELNDKFEPFRKLYTNPIRQKLPVKPADMETIRFTQIDEDKRAEYINYYEELVRFSYPNKFTQVYEQIRSVYKKFKSYPEIKDAFFYFHVKKQNSKIIQTLMKNEYYEKTPATYLALLDSFEIAKNSKNSLGPISSLIKKLKSNKIPVTNELLYKLYYTVPRQCRAPIKEVFEPEDLEHNVSRSFDEWKELLLDNKVPLTYATYIQLVNAMVREFRISEGLNLIYKLAVFCKVEIPPVLAKFTADQILMKEPELGLPAALYLQRITGCQLKQYAAAKITKNLVLSHKLNENTLELIKQFSKFNNEGNAKLISIINERVANDEHLRAFWESAPDSELSERWSQLYQGDDNFFKPGTDFDKIEEFTRLFPTNVKYLKLVEEIDELLASGAKREIWTEKLSKLQHDKGLFVKGCSYIIRKLIAGAKFSETVAFVELLKPEFNLEYESYLRMINAIMSGENFERNELELCTLLVAQLGLYHASFKREYLVRHAELVKVLDASNNVANKELLNASWDSYLDEVCKDVSFETLMDAL